MSNEKQAAGLGQETATAPQASGVARRRNAIILAVAIVFVVLAAAKIVTGNVGPDAASDSGDSTGPSITSIHNDAVADYDTALATGMPVYVLFHSLTCQPCVEISQVADVVVPEYEGRVAFVNAITGDPSGQQLASRFSFQYVPTSFFLSPDGTVIDTFTGAMSADEMRGYLDVLVETQ